MNKEKVLIIEDSMFTANLICDYLKNNEIATCGKAANFNEAKSLFQTNAPSIIICDIHLEGDKNGIEFVNEIRQHHPHVLIIFVSADMGIQTLTKAQETQPNGYLTKPFTEEQLITTIDMATIQRDKDHYSNFDLNDKDIEVLKLLGQGLSNKQIGEELFISHHTVDSRRRKILLKLNVTSINHALCIAAEKRWLQSDYTQQTN
jgi:DNA-binding NarL/FixJ family response regulator